MCLSRRRFGIFTGLTLTGIGAGVSTYLTSKASDYCGNLAANAISSTITLRTLNLTINGLPIHATNVMVNIQDLLTHQQVYDVPNDAADICYKTTWTLCALTIAAALALTGVCFYGTERRQTHVSENYARYSDTESELVSSRKNVPNNYGTVPETYQRTNRTP
jgi:hypothetical protein